MSSVYVLPGHLARHLEGLDPQQEKSESPGSDRRASRGTWKDPKKPMGSWVWMGVAMGLQDASCGISFLRVLIGWNEELSRQGLIASILRHAVYSV